MENFFKIPEQTTIKLTTVALEDNQHLIPIYHASIAETFCNGYKDGKRDKTIDGYYFTTELHLKPMKIERMPKDSHLFIK